MLRQAVKAIFNTDSSILVPLISCGQSNGSSQNTTFTIYDSEAGQVLWSNSEVEDSNIWATHLVLFKDDYTITDITVSLAGTTKGMVTFFDGQYKNLNFAYHKISQSEFNELKVTSLKKQELK